MIDPAGCRDAADLNEILSAMKERARETAGNESENTRDAQKAEWEKRKEAANIPPRYTGCSFEGIQRKGIPQDCRDLYSAAKEYADHFRDAAKMGKGLILTGSAGRMKTTFAVAIMQEAMRQGERAYFVSMPELLDRLISMSRNADPKELQTFTQKINHTGLLVLDDFGAEYPSGWVLNKVDAIITRRYNYLLPTIITSNLKPDEMKGRYVARVVDRLRSAYTMIAIGGESLRPDGGFLRP